MHFLLTFNSSYGFDISEHFLGDIKLYIKTKVKWNHQKNICYDRQKKTVTLEFVSPTRRELFYKL